jgi:hypothetical protein
LSAPGCGTGTEDHDEHEEHDEGEELCERRDETPQPITASATRQEAPTIEAGVPYLVTLPAAAPGFVALDVDEEMELLAFVEHSNILADLYHGETAEGVTPAGAFEHCPEVYGDHVHLDLHEPGKYALELGPTASDSAWLLLVDGDHAEHDH